MAPRNTEHAQARIDGVGRIAVRGRSGHQFRTKKSPVAWPDRFLPLPLCLSDLPNSTVPKKIPYIIPEAFLFQLVTVTVTVTVRICKT